MFKFYTITNDVIDNLIGEKASIKLSSAFNLNDPYELKFNLNIDPFVPGQKEEFYKSRFSATEDDFLWWQKHVSEHDGYTWYAEQEQRNTIAQSITLCSFTEDNTNNLMWSHYTNNHKGICVEYFPELFTYLKTVKDFVVYWKVKYSDEPPIVDSLESLTSKVKKMMFNKQSEWKYEKEHRIVFLSRNDTDFIPMDKKYIKAVYIGSRPTRQNLY